MKCKNCNSDVDSPYCPQCGQKSETPPLTYKSLAQSVTLSFGTIDRGMLRTLIDLFTRPAHMSIEYIHGKRVTFFAPFQLLFLVATLYMIIYYWSGVSSDYTWNGLGEVFSDELVAFVNKFIRFFQNNRGIMWTLCIPLQVFVFRLLYKPVRYRFTWVETCFIAAYFFSQVIIVELVIFLINLALPTPLVDENNMMFVYLFLLTYDMKQLAGGTWKSNVFKCILCQILFFATLMTLAVSVLVILAVVSNLEQINEAIKETGIMVD